MSSALEREALPNRLYSLTLSRLDWTSRPSCHSRRSSLVSVSKAPAFIILLEYLTSCEALANHCPSTMECFLDRQTEPHPAGTDYFTSRRNLGQLVGP